VDTSGAVLTMDMIEEAARTVIIGHGRPDSPFTFYQRLDYFKGTPYDDMSFYSNDLRAFAKLHRFLIKLKVCKYSPNDNYDYINGEGAERLKKKCLGLIKTARRIKKKEQRRKIYENLPFYQRSLPRHTRGRI
jgi:hypothetical protein